MSHYAKRDYTRLKNTINDIHSPKAHRLYHFPLVVDDLGNNSLNCKGHGSHFILLDMCHKEWKNNIPNIMICTSCDQTKSYDDLIATLAHEFGHFRSWQEGNHEMSDDAYGRYLSGSPFSHKTSEAVLVEEKLAWDYGFELLDENEFDITPDIASIRKWALGAYRRYSNRQTNKYYNLKK